MLTWNDLPALTSIEIVCHRIDTGMAFLQCEREDGHLELFCEKMPSHRTHTDEVWFLDDISLCDYAMLICTIKIKVSNIIFWLTLKENTARDLMDWLMETWFQNKHLAHPLITWSLCQWFSLIVIILLKKIIIWEIG